MFWNTLETLPVIGHFLIKTFKVYFAVKTVLMIMLISWYPRGEGVSL